MVALPSSRGIVVRVSGFRRPCRKGGFAASEIRDLGGFVASPKLTVLHVQVLDVEGVFFDEFATALDVFAH